MDPNDLFERYLQAVRKYLPSQRQDDIVAELRANLDAQREEREAGLGRPLTEGEMIDWLKELGAPMHMASRYQPPRYLIGPGIFPVYVHILRLAMIWISVAYAISIAVRLVVETHGPDWVAHQVLAYPAVLFTSAAWITAAFAVVEWLAGHYPEKFPGVLAPSPRWSPVSLPPIEKDRPAGSKPRTLATAVAELIVQFALLLWLLLIPSYPYVLLGPGAAYLSHSPIRPAPVLVVFFWTVVAFNALQIAWAAFNLLTDRWRMRSKVHHLAVKAMGLIPLAVLLMAPQQKIIELKSQFAHPPAGLDLAAINHYIYMSAVILALIALLDFASDLWKARRQARHQPSAALL